VGAPDRISFGSQVIHGQTMTTATTLTRILLLLSALLSLATATTTTLDRSESETKSERRKSGLGDGGSVSPSGEVSSQGLPRSLGIIITAVVTLLGFIIPAVVTLLIIAFLIAGAAFFTCSIVDCGSFTRGRGFNSILDGR